MSDEVHPYEPLDGAKSGTAAVHPHASFSQAIEEFDRAWRHPQHTPVELEPLDVNAMLQQDYLLSEPVRLTRSLLWDAEAKKAWARLALNVQTSSPFFQSMARTSLRMVPT